MIQQLITLIIALLKDGFNNIDIGDANIKPGPIAPPGSNGLPAIALYSGELSFDQDFTDVNASDPRPEEIRREMDILDGTPQGTYELGQIPLAGTMLMSAIYNPGEENEKKLLLQENVDYTISYQSGAINFAYDLSDAGRLGMEYKTPGIFTFRSFHQEFYMDVYDADLTKLEKWASLATAMILTRYNGLLDDYNEAHKTGYFTQGYQSRHQLSALHLLACTPDHADTASRLMRLKFRVRGTLRLSRTLDEPVGIIDKIYSPGKKESAFSVDIDAELE